MIAIRAEIDQVAAGDWPAERQPAAQRPAHRVVPGRRVEPPVQPRARRRTRPGWTRRAKYWPPVRRIDGAYGDRNLVCSCPPVADYA